MRQAFLRTDVRHSTPAMARGMDAITGRVGGSVPGVFTVYNSLGVAVVTSNAIRNKENIAFLVSHFYIVNSSGVSVRIS